MDISQNGLSLIEGFEGLRLTAYQDQVGVWTIGYGHTGRDVTPGLTITKDQANGLLHKDVQVPVQTINNSVKVALSQNQFDALVSFIYNLGTGSFLSSTLLKKLNTGDYTGAAQEFLRWNRAGGVVVQGLTNRRTKEMQLFQTA
jgi:lysozyme